MTTRPESLFPLFASLETLEGVGKKTAKLMEHLAVFVPRDMLFVLPHAVIDRRRRDTIQGLALPATATVEVEVLRHMPPRGRGAYRVQVADPEVVFELAFFHARRPYLEQILPVGERRLISGRLELYDGTAQMLHPDHVLPPDEGDDIPDWEPVYPLTAGVSQRVMAKAAQSVLARAPLLPEWIDPHQKSAAAWPDWQQALAQAHRPDSQAAVRPQDPARQRLAYDELFAHQLTLALVRARERHLNGRRSQGDGALRDRVLAALPYRPTGAQQRVVQEIAADMADSERMVRLLQGDVGAGKTLVALMAMLIAVEAGGQAVMMAPTEILARQHLEGLAPLAEAAGVRVEILTGRDRSGERQQKLADLASGAIHILVGTHAVFQESVQFADLRLAIVDEQHRFGVRQRMELGRKGQGADMLVMTATPIPRSLSMSQYGDLDVSVLDEKPPGRKPIRTTLAASDRLEEVVAHLDKATAGGRQAYWVCPLVSESERVELASAEERYRYLRARLGEARVGLIHGQMPAEQKDAAMAAFQRGETDILVATTVIEVGVNVPNASIMVIEQAESFGLAQLHQLRGRVGRGEAESTCLLLYQAPLSETGMKRLTLLRETEDGFRLAEADLAMRGAGDLLGTAQSGLPRFRIADLETQGDLLRLAQQDARALLAKDPDLSSPRGEAARTVLWLTGQDEAIRLISVG